jgi:hypothetical protein
MPAASQARLCWAEGRWAADVLGAVGRRARSASDNNSGRREDEGFGHSLFGVLDHM